MGSILVCDALLDPESTCRLILIFVLLDPREAIGLHPEANLQERIMFILVKIDKRFRDKLVNFYFLHIFFMLASSYQLHSRI